MDQNYTEQSTRLKNLIKALHLNQLSFAHSLGMTQPNISRMIRGEGKISAEVLNRITNTYKNVNLHWLLTGQGRMFLEQIDDYRQVNEPTIPLGKGRLEELEERVTRLEEKMKTLLKK